MLRLKARRIFTDIGWSYRLEIFSKLLLHSLLLCRLVFHSLKSYTRTPISANSGPHYTLFPRIIAEIISTHSVAELSFHLTQGRWYSSRWGLPPQPSGSTGAMVHAWIYGNETT